MAFLHDLETDLIEQEVIHLYENGVQLSEIADKLDEEFGYNFSINQMEKLLIITVNDIDDVDFIEMNLDKLYKRDSDINPKDFMAVQFDDPNDPKLIAEKRRLETMREEQLRSTYTLYSN